MGKKTRVISLRCSIRDLQSFHHLVLFFFLPQHRKHNFFHTILSHPETMDFTFPLFWDVLGDQGLSPVSSLCRPSGVALQCSPFGSSVTASPAARINGSAGPFRSMFQPFVKPARQKRSRGPTAVAKGLSCSTIGHSIGFLQADDQPWIDWSSRRNVLPHDGMLCCYGKL